MNNPELIILLINATLVFLSYFYVYPRMAGSDINKIAANDLVASIVALVVAASLFWGTGEEFNTLFFTLNWFWFSLLSYAAIETPFMLWYFKKHDVRRFTD